MRRKILTLFLALALVISCSGVSNAMTEKDIPIYIDGVKLETDQQPFIRDGRTFVPMRAIFEAMGAMVEYDPEINAVIATKGLIKMRMDYTGGMLFNNFKIRQTGTELMNINGVTYVPLRVVAETLYATVEWKDESVNITTNKTGYEEYPGIPDFGKFLDLKVVDTAHIKEGTMHLTTQLKTKATEKIHIYAVESAKKGLIADYQNELLNYGYVFRQTDKKDDSYNTTVYYYYNKDDGTQVSIHQVGTENYVVGVCIMVPVSLESLGLKATN